MATIVNNPGPTERVVEREDGTAGWLVAVIVLIAVIAGLFIWHRYYRANPAAQQPAGSVIQVNVPTPSGGSDTGGDTGGGAGAGAGASGGTGGSAPAPVQ